jgi:hypothetical protein
VLLAFLRTEIGGLQDLVVTRQHCHAVDGKEQLHLPSNRAKLLKDAKATFAVHLSSKQ